MILSLAVGDVRARRSDGAGHVLMTLAGDGAIRLDVEALEVTLKDVTRPYAATFKESLRITEPEESLRRADARRRGRLTLRAAWLCQVSGNMLRGIAECCLSILNPWTSQ